MSPMLVDFVNTSLHLYSDTFICLGFFMNDYVSLAYSLFLMNSVRTEIFPGGILIEQSFVSQKTENQPNLHNSPLQC